MNERGWASLIVCSAGLGIFLWSLLRAIGAVSSYVFYAGDDHQAYTTNQWLGQVIGIGLPLFVGFHLLFRGRWLINYLAREMSGCRRCGYPIGDPRTKNCPECGQTDPKPEKENSGVA